jgi:fibronectin-binding autotransporter adhesin
MQSLGEINTYTGSTQLNGGILAVSDTRNLGSAGNSVIFNGGTLQFAAGSTFDLSTRTVTVNSGGATIHTDGGNVTFANAIGNNGAGGLTKAAAGMLTLNGVNTYTGATTITGGTLALGSSGSISNSSGVTVGINTFFDVSAVTGYTLGSSTAQTLQGNGTVVGGVTVASGSTIRGGDATTAGTLTLTDGLSLNSGAQVGINIDAAGSTAAAGTGGSSSESNNSVLSITGGATISSGTVFAIDGTGVAFTLNQPYSYLIMTGAGNQSGLNITNPAQFETVGFSAESFSVTGTSGGDVFLNFTPVPVPEPATVLGIAVAALGVGGFVRRRFRKPSEPTSAA